MNKNVRFYVMHNRKTGDVEFVESGNRLRMRDMMLRGYENIGSGECKDVSELNRGICSNMRGMYEYQKRQSDELKVQLEIALHKLKEVHRISDTAPGTETRPEHMNYEGKQYNDEVEKFISSLSSKMRYAPEPIRKIVSTAEILREVKIDNSKQSLGFGHIRPFIKEFWEDVN